jgi:uncharacterized protein YjiS (DUF1127 family)
MKSYIAQTCPGPCPEHGSAHFGIVETLREAALVLATFRRRAETRRQLRFLDERDLRDIGIDPVDARRESAKPFWES